ncbi:MAG: hypothetical protein H0W50_11255 [Parachlamydiaceae bacterium]|nr:hypothetical protein [Parachlamydiaceae bacterium]
MSVNQSVTHVGELDPYAPNKDLRKTLLSRMIDKCSNKIFKSFYLNLLEGNTKRVRECIQQFSDQDITQIWAYCPPPLILKEVEKPSLELIMIVDNQRERAQLDEMNEEYRIHLLKDFEKLQKRHPLHLKSDPIL